MTHLAGLLLIGALLVVPLRAQEPASAASAAAKQDKVKLSYAIGYQIGSRFAEGTPDVDLPALQRAIADAYAKHKPAVPIQQMQAQLEQLQQHMHREAMARFRRIATENARKSADFMAQNREKPGVVQLPSGIQYSVLSKGTGTLHPKVTSTVVINYLGMLVDGTEFDSTWAHGAPVSFAIDKVIPGWRDVIPRMHVGDRWKVVIPPQLAYGEEGMLPRIGPNEALRFEIELLAIKPDHVER
ncbi:MAG: FKBP-type peptidyl-prolyl cis-trans isomerase [Rhodanobacter sp.]